MRPPSPSPPAWGSLKSCVVVSPRRRPWRRRHPSCNQLQRQRPCNQLQSRTSRSSASKWKRNASGKDSHRINLSPPHQHRAAPRTPPKVPAKPSRDTVTLKELRGEIDNALARSKKQDEQEQFNAKRSAFAQIAPTRQDQVPQGGRGDAWSLRNHGAQLAVQLLGDTDKPLPANTAFRPFSAAGTKA